MFWHTSFIGEAHLIIKYFLCILSASPVCTSNYLKINIYVPICRKYKQNKNRYFQFNSSIKYCLTNTFDKNKIQNLIYYLYIKTMKACSSYFF